MKINKDTAVELVILIVVCAAILFGWPYLMKYLYPQAAQPASQVSAQARTVAAPPAGRTAPQNAEVQQVADQTARSNHASAPEAEVSAIIPATQLGTAPVFATSLTMLKTEVLSDREMSVNFSIPETAYINSVVLEQYQNSARTAPVTLDNNSGLLTDASPLPLQPGALSVTSTTPWTVKSLLEHGNVDDHRTYYVERLISDASGHDFQLIQRWTLNDHYIVNCTVSFRGVSPQPLNLGTVVVSGGDLQSLPAITGDKERGAPFHKFDALTAANKFVSTNVKKDDFNEYASTPMLWVGVSNKYFAVALKGSAPFRPIFARAPIGGKEYLACVAAALDNVVVPAAGSGDLVYNFTYFAGPKIAGDLEAFSPAATGMMHLAWSGLDYLARLMLAVLVGLHSLCGSYGWSIIILTLIVRLLIFPLTRKANLSMKKMAAIQPKIKEIRDQYKDRPEIMNQKTMELYRAEKINPLGGCLPLLLQFPVFIALYQALSGAVQLRQSPFWWSPDLAGPDTVGHIFGLAINPLVLAMTALMVLQQWMTPSTMDPTQKKMMYFMPLVMLFLFYDMPSGLTLYWTVSQIFSILQMYIQRKWDNSNPPVAAGAKS